MTLPLSGDCFRWVTALCKFNNDKLFKKLEKLIASKALGQILHNFFSSEGGEGIHELNPAIRP